jgi:hypothetical protein
MGSGGLFYRSFYSRVGRLPRLFSDPFQIISLSDMAAWHSDRLGNVDSLVRSRNTAEPSPASSDLARHLRPAPASAPWGAGVMGRGRYIEIKSAAWHDRIQEMPRHVSCSGESSGRVQRGRAMARFGLFARKRRATKLDFSFCFFCYGVRGSGRN